MAFLITAKFVITPIRSAQKSADRFFFVFFLFLFFFSLTALCYSFENIRFGYLLESPRRGDSNKYTKRMIYKELFKNIRYSCFRLVHIQFLYNSKFDFTAKSLVIKHCRYNEGPLYIVPFGNTEPTCMPLSGPFVDIDIWSKFTDGEISTQLNLYCLMVTKGGF